MRLEDYKPIYEHYERTLEKYGPISRGMDWPSDSDLQTRFKVMLNLAAKDLAEGKQISILDLGCGAGLLLEYLQKNNLDKTLNYYGIDISEKMISAAKLKFPNESFEVQDILQNPLKHQKYDYIIMNGLLTEKLELSQDQMLNFAKAIIQNAYDAATYAIAFNVMSDHVSWKRDDLFHWPFDSLVEFLTLSCSRHIQLHMDYGLYEYTAYVYKNPHS